LKNNNIFSFIENVAWVRKKMPVKSTEILAKWMEI